MRSLLISAFTLLALSLPATAQASASFTQYAPTCGTATPLAYTGVPKIGGSFTVDGIFTPMLCTRKFCGCNVGPCNTCRGSILVIGAQRINVPVGPCPLYTLPLALVPGKGKVQFNVPNNTALFGSRFQMQRADVAMNEMIDSNCKTSYVTTSVMAFSDAVEGYVAL